MAWWGSGSPGAGVNIPRRPKAQGGFDSRPVADAATSGDRRLICMMTHAHHHGTAPVASRCAQPLVARRLNTGTAPKTSNSETRPDRPGRAKENQ